MVRFFGGDYPPQIGMAVSGGADSMAMLHMAHKWAQSLPASGRPVLRVVTVDHGLRATSAQEARMVAEQARNRNLSHDTLSWKWDRAGNLQQAAREARLELIERWRSAINVVLFAHTRDDVAETLLLRLARGSGVDGLRSIAPLRSVRVPCQNRNHTDPGFVIARPCLEIGRADLRDYANAQNIPFFDDPSNEDERFERAKARKAIAALGLSTERLGMTAKRMDLVSQALEARARSLWHTLGHEGRANGVPTGEIIFERDPLWEVERETQERLVAAALCYVSGIAYRPRLTALGELLSKLKEGRQGGTLHGCEVRLYREKIVIFREYAAVDNLSEIVGQPLLWDGRWQVEPTASAKQPGQSIRALGESGWKQIKQEMEPKLPFVRARPLPSIWSRDQLISCPALGYGPPVPTVLCPYGDGKLDFETCIALQ